MIATIYLPFLLYNEDVFHKEINTYDYVSYADTLINDYNKNKDVVNDYMNSGINNNSTVKFNANNQQNSFSDEEYTYCIEKIFIKCIKRDEIRFSLYKDTIRSAERYIPRSLFLKLMKMKY